MSEKIHILVVDDDPGMSDTLSDILDEKGYSTSVAESGAQAIELVRKHFYNVALVDIRLPDMNGIHVLQEVKKIHPEMILVIITAHATLKNAIDALNEGADAYITKPLDLDELKAIIKKEVSNQKLLFEKTRLEKELVEDFMATIETLATLIEVKDPYLAGHSKEVKKWSCLMAERLGLSQEEIKDIEMAAILHDIGKIGVKGRILDTHGSLSVTEFQEVKLHPLLGEGAIKQIRKLENASKIVRHHHEFWDGRGYPDGLKGEKIPIGSRIISVADAFNAMTSDRPYRKALSSKQAISRLISEKGKQFDPRVIDTFVDYLKKSTRKGKKECQKQRF